MVSCITIKASDFPSSYPDSSQSSLFSLPEESHLGAQGLAQPLVGVPGLQVGYVGPLNYSLSHCLVTILGQEPFIFQHIPGHPLIVWAWGEPKQEITQVNKYWPQEELSRHPAAGCVGYMPLTPASRRQRQEDLCEFQVSQSYTVRPGLIKTTTTPQKTNKQKTKPL